jgi:hypothetical protein
MEITKKHLVDLVREIGAGIDRLNEKLEKQNREIEDLKLQNRCLKENNRLTLDKIKEYIKELEQIRSHYVDSNNKSK